jgi:hypothetical protein
MRQWLRWAGLLAMLFASIATAHAQRQPGRTVALGDSAVVLDGPWRVHSGDNPAWASPNFDDSAWPQVTGPRQTDGIAWYRMRSVARKTAHRH